MRKLLVLAALFSPLALAQAVIEVDSHAVMRLPSNTSVLLLDRLEIADHGTLLIPPGLTEIRVAQLTLGRDARLAIAPSDQVLRLEVDAAEIASGAQISARGAQGSAEKPALPEPAFAVCDPGKPGAGCPRWYRCAWLCRSSWCRWQTRWLHLG